MTRYKITESGIHDTENNLHIPNDESNRHWQEYQEWVAVEGNIPDPQYTAEEVINSLKDYAKSIRDSRETSGTVTITLGSEQVPFDADFNSIQRIAGASRASARAARGNATLSLDWTDANDNTRTLTGADLEALDNAIMARAQGLHSTYRQILADINAGTVKSESEVDSRWG